MSETTNRNVPSDAAWYCRHDPEEERFYEIFFKLCKKYNVKRKAVPFGGRTGDL